MKRPVKLALITTLIIFSLGLVFYGYSEMQFQANKEDINESLSAVLDEQGKRGSFGSSKGRLKCPESDANFYIVFYPHHQLKYKAILMCRIDDLDYQVSISLVKKGVWAHEVVKVERL